MRRSTMTSPEPAHQPLRQSLHHQWRKILEDGAMGSRGAWFLEAYSDRPAGPACRNTPKTSSSRWTRSPSSTASRWPHAIGDAANRYCAERLRAHRGGAAEADQGPALPHRARAGDCAQRHPRFKKLHVIPSMQAQHATSDMNMAEDRIGPERIRAPTPGKLLKTGVVIPDGSDAPVESVTRTGACTRRSPASTGTATRRRAGGWYPRSV